LSSCLRALSRNIYHHRKNYPDCTYAIILVGDSHIQNYGNEVSRLLPDVEILIAEYPWTEGKNYQTHAQLTIAQMRTRCAEEARAWDADYCWSVDSDVIVPDNGLTCSLQMLEFDQGYYSVACCPYPSQGGGGYLCGRGTPQRPILPDFVFEEKEAPTEMLERREQLISIMGKGSFRHQDMSADMAASAIQKIEEWVEEHSPAKFGGDVWKIIASYGWRPRGWLDNAYPGIGLGAVVPTDWCGFGATLMNADALAAVDFTGYDGRGTEDLFIVWLRWYPRGLKLCAIPHVPCDHIIRTGSEKKIVHQRGYHETEGEMRGHLRIQSRPFLQQIPGERLAKDNDGVPGKLLPPQEGGDYQI